MSRILEIGRQGKPLNDTLVVDFHTHLFSWWRSYQAWGDVAGIIQSMDRYGIDKCCISGVNDLVLDAVAQHPDRLIGFVIPDPNYPDEIEAENYLAFRQPISNCKMSFAPKPAFMQ